MTDAELHTLEVELDEYGAISKADALRLIAEIRQWNALFASDRVVTSWEGVSILDERDDA